MCRAMLREPWSHPPTLASRELYRKRAANSSSWWRNSLVTIEKEGGWPWADGLDGVLASVPHRDTFNSHVSLQPQISLEKQ